MKFIEIEQKKYPVEFNMAALLEAQDVLEISIPKILSDIGSLTENQLLRLYYLGIKYGAEEYDRKPQISYSRFVTYTLENRECLEEITQIIMTDLVNTAKVLLEQTKIYNQAAESEEVDPAKKKVTKKQSGRTTSGS
jgi:hypothetical protein